MPLYFRSDTRSPDKIFKKGFMPREETGEEWASNALYFDDDMNVRIAFQHAQDADRDFGICMSTKFESAVIFPTDKSIHETYVYVISLPEATKLKYSKEGKVTLDVECTFPVDIKNVVLDLHSLQATQARLILNDFKKSTSSPTFFKERRERTLEAAWPLYAYEAVAYQVPAQDIICAVKCSREELQVDRDLIHTEFKVKSDIISNPQFKSFAENNQRDAFDLLNELKAKNYIATPTLHYGLGGKTF